MSSEPRWVLVTGASTGIGRSCVEYLAKNGFKVYAGARKEDDLAELGKIESVETVKLDVTEDDDVQAVKESIEAKGTGLYGLVNNAGIGIGGPLMDVTNEEMQQQIAVNLLGVHRVTRALFPFILKAKGRVVMMSSDSGRIAMPFLEGYADTLREEMLLLGVKVILVEPGMIKTPIWDKSELQLDKAKNRTISVDLLVKLALNMMPNFIKEGKTTGKDPIEVAKIVHEALTVKKPRDRYPVMDQPWKFKLGQLLGAKTIDKMVLKEFTKAMASMNEPMPE